MTTTLVDIRTPRVQAPLGLLQAFSHVVLDVSRLDAARRFYGDGIGLALEGESDATLTFSLGAARVVLVQRDAPPPLPDSGRHVAIRLPAAATEAAVARLAAQGVIIHDYHEDRPLERDQNRYCVDPDGNRLQLVEGETAGIDHAAIETHDMEWAETFYTHVLGGCVETRVGWRMADFERALAWGEGRDACAPGTRRWDKRYTTMEGQALIPRPSSQIFVDFGGPVLGIYLATEHRQEPPLDQFVGTPRLAFQAAPGQLDALAGRLATLRLRCMKVDRDTGGPFTRESRSLFVRDPSGNFLEIVGH